MNKIETKLALLTALKAEIDSRIESDKFSIDAAKDAADAENTGGFTEDAEAGIAMMQLEQEKYLEQLEVSLDIKKRLTGIQVTSLLTTIQVGAVAITSFGNYFIAISGEDIEVANVEYTPISLASPLGMILKDCKVGDKVAFRSQNIEIIDIY